MWFKKIKKPILALAPLADHTDSPFCCTCRWVYNNCHSEFVSWRKKNPLKRRERLFANAKDDKRNCFIPRNDKSDFVVFREMVSAEAIVRGNEKTLKMCKFKKEERPIVIQIFGSNSNIMAKATEIIIKKFKPDGIDINMGCPVLKIAGKAESGAFLMKDYLRACEIVREVKKVLPKNIALSVKTRLGWNDSKEILEFAPKLEKAGADLLTIHGRTKIQGYSGVANWDMIGRIKKNLKIPVLANGDITEENYKECLEITRADGIMIGRGSLGNPWIFNQFIANSSQPIDLKERIKTILYHAKLHEKQYGNLVSFRKHLMWYFKGNRVDIKNLKLLRQELIKIESLKDLKDILY